MHSILYNDLLLFYFTGYEIIGLEKIPEEGPALIIYYHGAIPIDFYYVMAKCVLHRNRHIRAVGDRFLFNIPGKSIVLIQIYFIIKI